MNNDSPVFMEHYYVIRVLNRADHKQVVFMKWSGLRFDLLTKYRWYFRYRAALLQVQYPKFEVSESWGHHKAEGQLQQQIFKNMLRSKKAKVTEYQNKLKKVEQAWTSMFPIEDDPLYLRAKAKVASKEKELADFVNNHNL